MAVKGMLDPLSCYGCRACESICPKQCITMIENNEGFVYPDVSLEICVNCGLCEKVCPVNYEEFIYEDQVNVFVCKNNDNSTVVNSSSGGAFSALYSYCINNGYIVYGVRFDDNLNVIHDRAVTNVECESFRKSKYIQSNTNNCFVKTEEDLKQGKKVLFSGTPCQCAALDSFLQLHSINRNNLLLINMLCHGAPSQKIFDIYREELEKKSGEKLKTFVFRSKKPINNKVNSRSAELIFESGRSRLVDMTNDPFLNGYYNRLFLRESCSACKFARRDRTADITLADAWQIEKVIPEWNSHIGASLLFINTAKGDELFKLISSELEIKKSTMDWAVSVQDVLSEPTTLHYHRKRFFKKLKKYGFKKAVFDSTHVSIIRRGLYFIKRKLFKGKN